MLTPEQINDIHRLHWVEKWSVRKIARQLPSGTPDHRQVPENAGAATRTSGPQQQAGLLQAGHRRTTPAGSTASAALIAQRLRPLGFDGGITIVKDYVRARAQKHSRPAGLCPHGAGAGERFDIDWGHFGALDYTGTPRKLYAFCLVECHSRKMYLEFTHSQSFETFVRCHMHAFEAMAGIARELWYDNLATAVAEHDGNLVRFNPRFLAFARENGFFPRACHVAAAWEKGKSNALSDMCGRTSGRCARSPIWRT